MAFSLGGCRRCTERTARAGGGRSFLLRALRGGQVQSSRLGGRCAPSAEGAAWAFANPSLEVKLQTLAKEKGYVEEESAGLPPTPKEMTT